MKDTIKSEIIDLDLSFFLSHRVFERVPHIFKNIEQYLKWKNVLTNNLEVDPSSILIIGSASLGLSLNPNKNFKEFNDNSDIDIAVISQYHFDTSWRTLRNLGTDRFKLTPKQIVSLEDHKKRLIYWGTIATDKLLPIFPFGKSWMIAIENMKNFYPTKKHDINLRIYKDFESLRSYHIHNLKQIKNNLLS